MAGKENCDSPVKLNVKIVPLCEKNIFTAERVPGKAVTVLKLRGS
jgi:hypothetical protein